MVSKEQVMRMLERLAELDDKYHIRGLNEQEYREYLALLDSIKKKV